MTQFCLPDHRQPTDFTLSGIRTDRGISGPLLFSTGIPESTQLAVLAVANCPFSLVSLS